MMILKRTIPEENTLAQQCYELLEAEIIEGVLAPGTKLKVEPIKQRLGIGQSPIREALSRLVAVGLVEVEDNKGFRVATISEDDVRDTYAIFADIENLALTRAIKNGDQEWEASIVAALYKLGLVEGKKERGRYEEWVVNNYNFHKALIAGCNSPVLLDIRNNLYKKFDRYCRIAYHAMQHSLAHNHEEHKKLSEAVLARDTKKAQALMTHHLNGGLDDVIQILKQSKMI
jgi:DNA-binding GntR family transcriptional regulator